MYRFLAKFYPKKIKEDYVDLLKYSNIKINPDRFMGFIVLSGFLLAFAAGFYLGLLFNVPFWLLVVGFFFLFEISIYFLLLLKADAKAKFVEDILPDVLQLMASNLRAGLTTDKALLLSARPEFGSFQDELNQVGKEITMGKSVGEALLEMSKRIKSERLHKTIALIVSGIRSGGELASLLEQSAKNLRQQRLVDSRIRANVMMYVIFIFIAVCFGAPMLFGLSSFLIEVLTSILGGINLPETATASMSISFSDVSISVDFVLMFSVLFLVTSSILGSMIIGLISKGKEREGIKYMPIMIALSLGMFFLIRYGVKSMLGGLFGF